LHKIRKCFSFVSKSFQKTTLDAKIGLHKLIDSINDEIQLNRDYQLIKPLSTVKENGALLSKLLELLEIEKESHLPNNLIGYEEIMKSHKKRL
jgi:hypothetical protein